MSQTSTARIIPSRDRLLALIAVLVVTVFANSEMFKLCDSGALSAVIGLAVFFAVEVAIIAIFCGLSRVPEWLKWATMVWIFALVNLQLVSIGVFQSDSRVLPIASLFASQYGLLVTWLIMGSGHWVQRSSVTGILAALLSLGASSVIHDVWFTIVFCFVVALVLTLLLLRYFGFRMVDIDSWSDTSDLQPAQFGLRHAMILTTILALVMGVLKSQEDWVLASAVGILNSGSIVMIVVGLSSAIVVELGCWAALGQGRYYVRYGILLLAAALLGTAVSFWFRAIFRKLSLVPIGTPLTEWDYRLWHLAALQWQWIAWFMLTGVMLVASLAFFRIQGLRFARTGTNL